MSRKLRYDPNLYGEGRGGTFDIRVGERGFIASNRKLRGGFLAARCIWCRTSFDMWSSDRAYLIHLLHEAGWIKTRSRNWKCPECQKLKTNPAIQEVNPC